MSKSLLLQQTAARTEVAFARLAGHPAFVCLLLAAATLAVFEPVVGYDFVNYDDPGFVTENPHVLAGLTRESLTWALRTEHFGNWVPLTWLSHMLDVQLFGLKAGGHHLTNLLLHVANTVWLFLLLRRLTAAYWRSAFVAALFAWHPLHVESVAWIAERRDVLSLFFFLLTIWAYVRYVTSGKWQVARTEAVHRPRRSLVTGHWSLYYCLALLFFALGLMSKAIVVTLPVVLLLLDYWPLRRLDFGSGRSPWHRLSGLLWEKLPFLAMGLVSGVITLWVQAKVGCAPSLAQLPIRPRLCNATLSCVQYLRQMLWPRDLAYFYTYPRSFSIWAVAGAGLLLLLISILAVLTARRRPYWMVGWFWYLATLLPVVGLIQTGPHAHADRYTYIPLIGVFVIISWGATDLMSRWPCRKAVLVLAAGLLLAACVWSTRVQLRYWRNSLSLFTHAAAVSPDSALVHNNLGGALFAEGRLEEARVQFAWALKLQPHDIRALNNFGMVLRREGKLDEAIQHFAEALRLKPDDDSAHNNYGVLLLGQGKLDEAAAHFSLALQTDPSNADAHNGLGIVLARQGKLSEAVVHFTEAVRLQPGNLEAQSNLGRALYRQGKVAAAAAHYARAFGINLREGEADDQIGQALAKRGDVDEAIAYFERALERGTNVAGSHYHLGNALLLRGRAAEGIAHYREALRLRPDFVPALNDLAWTLATYPATGVRDGAEATKLAERAAALTQNADAGTLDTLAAAYAEVGRFDEAVKTARQAVALAEANGRKELAAQLRHRLELYERKQPYHE